MYFASQIRVFTKLYFASQSSTVLGNPHYSDTPPYQTLTARFAGNGALSLH